MKKQISKCSDLNTVYSDVCKSYGCVPTDADIEVGTCTEFDGCSSVKDYKSCDDLIDYKNESEGKCAWNSGEDSSSPPSCVKYT